MDDIASFSAPILQTIKSSSNILLHLHPTPDPDSIGGALAIAEILKFFKKQVTVISGDTPKSQMYSALPGYDQIKQQTYANTDIFQYDLFIILDSASLGQISKEIQINFPPHLKTIVIDHHPSNQGFADINLIDSSSPSVCQILFYLFQSWQITIPPSAALNLYIGMHSDTGGFKYQLTTSKTLFAAYQLASINPDFPKYIFALENHQHPDMLRFLGLALSNITLYANYQIAISTVSFSDLDQFKIKYEHLQNNEVANLLKSVVGWEISASLLEINPNQTKVSLRTRNSNKYNLGKIASILGGGGHEAAAGVTLNLPLDQAVKILLKTINELYPQDFILD